MAWFFDAVAECSQWSHYFRANFYAQGRRHAIFGYLSIGFVVIYRASIRAIICSQPILA